MIADRQSAKAQPCAATGCDTLIRSCYLVCRAHWWLVPGQLREALWYALGPGRGSAEAEQICEEVLAHLATRPTPAQLNATPI